MKIRFFIIFCLAISFCLCENLYAFGNKLTHPALTNKAVGTGNSAAKIDDYLKNELGLDNGMATELEWNFPSEIKERIKEGKEDSNKKTRTVLEWLKTGSNIEDEDGRQIPWRPRHHFHDPNREDAALDNHTDHPGWDAPGLVKLASAGGISFDLGNSRTCFIQTIQ